MYGLYTDDVQLLHKIFLIYDYQCAYSPLNRYLNFYYRTPTILFLHLSICMYVCI